jgi:hypothetical protein
LVLWSVSTHLKQKIVGLNTRHREHKVLGVYTLQCNEKIYNATASLVCLGKILLLWKNAPAYLQQRYNYNAYYNFEVIGLAPGGILFHNIRTKKNFYSKNAPCY